MLRDQTFDVDESVLPSQEVTGRTGDLNRIDNSHANEPTNDNAWDAAFRHTRFTNGVVRSTEFLDRPTPTCGGGGAHQLEHLEDGTWSITGPVGPQWVS